MDTLVIALNITGAFEQVWHVGLMEKFCAKGIQGQLIFMSDYLQGKTYHAVVNVQQSRNLPPHTGVGDTLANELCPRKNKQW